MKWESGDLVIIANLFLQTLTRSSSLFLQLVLLTALWATSFLVNPELFKGIVSAKQKSVETVVLFAIPVIVLLLIFRKSFRISVVDLLVILFCAWSLFNESVLLNSPFRDLTSHLFTLSLWLTIYLFVRSFTDKNILLWSVVLLWMTLSLLHSVFGLMQLYGFVASYHGLFKITGAFHNPGPFSDFVVSGLPIALGVIGYTELHGGKGYSEVIGENTERHGGIYLKWLEINIPFNTIKRYIQLTLAWVTLAAILLVLPLAQSRAAWIAGLSGVSFLVFCFRHRILFIDSLISSFRKMKRSLRPFVTVIGLLVVVASATGFYLFKQGSADGRWLIWRVTADMIKQNPLGGHGAGAFNALYMEEQANWFVSKKGSEVQAMVAGSPEAPFNELLKLWLEKGLIGLLIAGVLIFYLIRMPQSKNASSSIPESSTEQLSSQNILIIGLQVSLITLLVFSLFSYPFDISSFLLQLVVVVAVLAGYSKPVIHLTGNKRMFVTIPLSLLLVFGTIHFTTQRKEYYKALKTWQQADRLYNMNAYNRVVEAYEEALPTLKINGLFLQMYGKALNMDEQYEQSNKMLALAQKRLSSQIIQNTLGDNHKALGYFTEAEMAYTKSANMIPSLIYPKYLLAKLYTESGQHYKAQQTAEKILNSNVKVESSATREIMKEMKEIITQSKR